MVDVMELYETNDYVSKHDIILLPALHGEVPPRSWQTWRALHCSVAAVALALNAVTVLVVYGGGASGATSSRMTPVVQLATNLCFTNILAAWAVVTMYFPPTSCQEEIQTALMMTSFVACALTLMAYAVCYYVQVFHTLEYNTRITRGRLWLLLGVIWLTALLLAHLHFLLTLAHHHSNTIVCYQVFENTSVTLMTCVGLAALLVAFVGVIILRILLKLRPPRNLTTNNNDNNQTDNSTVMHVAPRYSTRDVTTLAIVTSCYVVTWLPLLVVMLEHLEVHNNNNNSSHEDGGYSVAMLMFTFMLLVLVNSVVSPVVCALRLDGIVYGFERVHLKVRAWLLTACSRVSERLESGREQMTSSAAPLNPIESVC